MTKLDQTAKLYILSCIDASGAREVEPETFANKIAFLQETFQAEYGWKTARVGEQKAVHEWLQGLPSSLNIVFNNCDILDLARKWGSLSEDATEKAEDKILANYWNFMAGKVCQLFRGSRVPPEPVKNVRAEIYDFGHDMYGNPTSHFTVWVDGSVAYRTKRRQQCGYGSDRADGALVAAEGATGHPLRLLRYDGRRSDGQISATFEVAA